MSLKDNDWVNKKNNVWCFLLKKTLIKDILLFSDSPDKLGNLWIKKSR